TPLPANDRHRGTATGTLGRAVGALAPPRGGAQFLRRGCQLRANRARGARSPDAGDPAAAVVAAADDRTLAAAPCRASAAAARDFGGVRLCGADHPSGVAVLHAAVLLRDDRMAFTAGPVHGNDGRAGAGL